MDRKLYFKVYQDKENTNISYVETIENVIKYAKEWAFNAEYDGELPPCIEPVLMTEDEFKALPEFDGY